MGAAGRQHEPAAASQPVDQQAAANANGIKKKKRNRKKKKTKGEDDGKPGPDGDWDGDDWARPATCLRDAADAEADAAGGGRPDDKGDANWRRERRTQGVDLEEEEIEREV